MTTVSSERRDQPDKRPDADDEETDPHIESNRLLRLDCSILFFLAPLLELFDRLLDRVGMSAMWARLGSTRNQSNADPAWDCHIAGFYGAV